MTRLAAKPFPFLRRALALGFAAALGAAGACGLASGSAAAKPQHAAHRDWETVVTEENGKPLCFIGSVPQKQEGDFGKRGKVLILITHRPAEKSFGNVSVQAGYIYKPGSEALVEINGRLFTLFTDGGYAWTRNPEADKELQAAMKVGRTLSVKGTSNRGTVTTDRYSLDGFSAAMDAINSACKAPRASS